MADNININPRTEELKSELGNLIWNMATNLVHGGTVSPVQFMDYTLGALFYRFISENITDYCNQLMKDAGVADADYANMSDENAESGDKTNINDDIEFEMELVKQVEVNIDYILFLVQQMQGDRADIAELTIQINKAIDSSPDLRDKKDLINRFIESLTPDSEVTDKWKEYVDAEKRKEFERIVSEEHLKEGPAKEFIETAWERGYVPEGGLELNAIMPPINPFDPNANREGKLQKVLGKIKGFFGKFFEIAGGEF